MDRRVNPDLWSRPALLPDWIAAVGITLALLGVLKWLTTS